MRRKWIFIAPLASLGMLLFVFIGGELVLQLWNWWRPPLFGFRQITFWQGLGILLLCRILFGGYGLRGSDRPKVRSRIADRLADRLGHPWDAMTPEERGRFRQRLPERCGFGGSTSARKGKD